MTGRAGIAACEKSVACSTCHVILEEDVYDKLEEPDDDENVRARRGALGWGGLILTRGARKQKKKNRTCSTWRLA